MPRRFSLTAIILATVLSAAVVVGFPFLMFYRQSSLALETFRKQANDVQPVIEAVYRYSFETGNWPESVEELSDPNLADRLDGWQYIRLAGGELPLLRTSGPMHLSLEYRFRDRGDLTAPGGWHCRSEGDPVRFECEERIPAP